MTPRGGDLFSELAELPTKRRYPLPEIVIERWAEPDTTILVRVLEGLRRL